MPRRGVYPEPGRRAPRNDVKRLISTLRKAGYTTRRPIQVAVYVTKATAGIRKYLILHRKPNEGDIWPGVTGGVEDNETLLEAATRELREETELANLQLVQIDYTQTFETPENMRHHFDPPSDTLTEYVFYATVSGEAEPKLNGKEHDEWKWLTLEDALDALYWEENKVALKQCDKELRGAE